MTSSNNTKGLVYIFTGDGKGKTSAALGVAMRAVCAGKHVAIVQWYKNRQWDVSEFHLPEYFGNNLRIFPMGAGFHLANSKLKTQNSKLKVAPLKGGGVVADTASEEEHRRAAQEALHLAKELLTHAPESHVLKIVDEWSEAEGFRCGVSPRTVSRGATDFSPWGSTSDSGFPLSQVARQPSSPLFLLVLDEVINAVNDGLLALPALLDLLSLRGPTHLILTGRGAPKKLIDIADLVTEMKNVKHPYERGLKAVQGLDF